MPRARLAIALWLARMVFAQQSGEPLPPWSPGTLDIHQIHTGRGNAAFLVFPDSTTLLLDAGAVPDRTGLEVGPRRPNASRSPAEWIAHYIRSASPRTPPELDYAVITHFHDDHIAALPQLAALVPIRVLVDRGDDPAPPPYPALRPYFEFRRKFPGQVEPLRVGRSDQIVPRRDPGRAPGFEVRNIAGNGLVWAGNNTAATRFPDGWRNLPAASQPSENDFSLALLVRYGRFRYFTGGDLAGVPLDDAPEWRDLETPVARAAGPADVVVLNHHGWLDSTNSFFLRTMRPRAVVIPAWHATHPDHSVLRRLRSPGSTPAPDLFITSLLDAPRAIFSYLGESFRSTEGHIVVRVAPGGQSYRIIILDDLSESMRVKAAFGPYESRSE